MESRLIAVLLAILLSGCVPARQLDAPGYDLAIVDAKTQKPIFGALVRVNGGDPSKQLVSMVSDANGRVQAERVMHTAWRPLKHELRVPPIHLTISAEGYQTRELSGFDPLFVPRGCVPDNCHYDWDTVVDTARIALEPL